MKTKAFVVVNGDYSRPIDSYGDIPEILEKDLSPFITLNEDAILDRCYKLELGQKIAFEGVGTVELKNFWLVPQESEEEEEAMQIGTRREIIVYRVGCSDELFLTKESLAMHVQKLFSHINSKQSLFTTNMMLHPIHPDNPINISALGVKAKAIRILADKSDI